MCILPNHKVDCGNFQKLSKEKIAKLNGVVGEGSEMVSIPERPLAHVTVIAVRQQCPEARASPLAVGFRLPEPPHRVGDHYIGTRLQRRVAVPIEAPRQLPPIEKLQET